MIPGHWMISVVNDDGVPSRYESIGVNVAPDFFDGFVNRIPKPLPVCEDQPDIHGPFAVHALVRFEDLDGGFWQRVFDFGNGPAMDNILLGQAENSSTMRFEIIVDGAASTLDVEDAIVEGEIALFTASVDQNGKMTLRKNGKLIGAVQGVVPSAVDRINEFVGKSNWEADTPLLGEVYSLSFTDMAYPDQPTEEKVTYPDYGNCPAEAIIGEVGKVTSLTDDPQTVTLQRDYADPVVIAQSPSKNGPDPAVVRITDVTSSSFTFHIHEPPNMDGIHPSSETVSYLVVETGSWKLADGTELRAGKLDTSATVGYLLSTNGGNEWATVDYGGTFPASPVVLSQVQTENDPSWVKTRQTNATASSFQVALEKDEASQVTHSAETVGWLALSPGNGTWSGRCYVADRTGTEVTEAWHPVSFNQDVGSDPHFLSAMSTYNGDNNAALRYRNLTGASVEVQVQEDTTYDPEVLHVPEVVDYLVIGGGASLLKASAN